jgi:hypothetical protein
MLQGIAVEPDGQLIVLEVYSSATSLEAQAGRVIRVDPYSGVRTLVADLGKAFASFRYSVAVEASGQLVVLEVTEGFSGEPGPIPVWNEVIRVDPRSGTGTVVSDGVLFRSSFIHIGTTRGSGPFFGHLRGIAVEATGQIVVADDTLGAVLRVEPQSGDRAIIAR